MAINKLFILLKHILMSDIPMWYDEDVSFRFKITFRFIKKVSTKDTFFT
ncbi:MAG: hypothetical protein U0L84_07610 [Acutalibacteraceae bacterium]|nr:hypothetical protein [Acutalibacteraceae bacterium]